MYKAVPKNTDEMHLVVHKIIIYKHYFSVSELNFIRENTYKLLNFRDFYEICWVANMLSGFYI